MDRFYLGSNAGGVDNYAFFDEPTGELRVIDYQSGQVIQSILDENAAWRQSERHDFHTVDMRRRENDGRGRKVASIPVTVWVNWRREWMRHWRDVFTYQTFLLRKLHDPENRAFLTTERPFQDTYERDRNRAA